MKRHASECEVLMYAARSVLMTFAHQKRKRANSVSERLCSTNGAMALGSKVVAGDRKSESQSDSVARSHSRSAFCCSVVAAL